MPTKEEINESVEFFKNKFERQSSNMNTRELTIKRMDNLEARLKAALNRVAVCQEGCEGCQFAPGTAGCVDLRWERMLTSLEERIESEVAND